MRWGRTANTGLIQRFIQWDVSWVHSTSIDDISYMPKGRINSFSCQHGNSPPHVPSQHAWSVCEQRTGNNWIVMLNARCHNVKTPVHYVFADRHDEGKKVFLRQLFSLSRVSKYFREFVGVFFCSVLYKCVIPCIRQHRTCNSSRDAITNRIMLPLFSVRIPVPGLFFSGQSRQCGTAMGGRSHYLSSITFLWPGQAQKYSFKCLFFPVRTSINCLHKWELLRVLDKFFLAPKTQ